jgi:hypothetical protein
MSLIVAMGGLQKMGPNLPVLRWADVAGVLSNRADGLIEQITSLFTNIPLNIEGTFLSLGNELWGAAAWMVSMSQSKSEGLKGVFGPAMNTFAGKIYTAINTSFMVPFLIIMLAALGGMWAVFRGQGSRVLMKKVGAMGLGLGLFLSMGAASAAHPTTDAPMTPYWTVNQVSNIVTLAGSRLSDAFDASLTTGTTSFLSSTAPGIDQLSCRRYVAQLERNSKDGEDGVGKSATLIALNRMWEETGLRIWARAQYGPGDNSMQVFCRALEARGGVSGFDQGKIAQAAAGGHAPINRNAAAWWPNMLVSAEKNPTSNQMLDRAVTMFDVCGLKDGKFYARPGFGFIQLLTGGHRGLSKTVTDSTGVDLGATSGLPDVEEVSLPLSDQCSAAINGRVAGQRWNYEILQPPGKVAHSKIRGQKWNWDSSGNDAGGDSLRAIVNKFDIKSDSAAGWNGDQIDWQTAAASSDSNNGNSLQNNAAINTINSQHGVSGLTDIGGSIVFALSGLVNFVIWGLGLGLLQMLAVAMSFLLAGVGLYFGFLIWAVMPDKGSKAVGNAVKQMVAACAGITIISIIASVLNTIINAFMAALGVIDGNGNTTGTVMTMSVASLVLPPAAIMLLKYMCTNVWKIGNPFSAEGLGALVGGGAILKGVGNAAKGLAGGAIGGAAALMGGGGVMAALGAARSGAASAASGKGVMGTAGGLADAAGRGHGAGQMDRFYRERNESMAEKAVGGGETKDRNPTEGESVPGSDAEPKSAEETARDDAIGASGADKAKDGEEPVTSEAEAAATGGDPTLSMDGEEPEDEPELDENGEPVANEAEGAVEGEPELDENGEPVANEAEGAVEGEPDLSEGSDDTKAALSGIAGSVKGDLREMKDDLTDKAHAVADRTSERAHALADGAVVHMRRHAVGRVALAAAPIAARASKAAGRGALRSAASVAKGATKFASKHPVLATAAVGAVAPWALPFAAGGAALAHSALSKGRVVGHNKDGSDIIKGRGFLNRGAEVARNSYPAIRERVSAAGSKVGGAAHSAADAVANGAHALRDARNEFRGNMTAQSWARDRDASVKADKDRQSAAFAKAVADGGVKSEDYAQFKARAILANRAGAAPEARRAMDAGIAGAAADREMADMARGIALQNSEPMPARASVNSALGGADMALANTGARQQYASVAGHVTSESIATTPAAAVDDRIYGGERRYAQAGPGSTVNDSIYNASEAAAAATQSVNANNGPSAERMKQARSAVEAPQAMPMGQGMQSAAGMAQQAAFASDNRAAGPIPVTNQSAPVDSGNMRPQSAPVDSGNMRPQSAPVSNGNMQQVPVNSGNMRPQSAPVSNGNMQQVPVNAGSVGQSAPANNGNMRPQSTPVNSGNMRSQSAPVSNGNAQQHAVQQTLPVDSGAMHDRQSRAQTMSADRSKPSGDAGLNDRKAAFLDDSRPKLAETRRFAQTAPEPGAQSSLDDKAPGGGSRGPGLANTGENEARVAFERRQSEMDAAMDDAPDWAANGFGD